MIDISSTHKNDSKCHSCSDKNHTHIVTVTVNRGSKATPVVSSFECDLCQDCVNDYAEQFEFHKEWK